MESPSCYQRRRECHKNFANKIFTFPSSKIMKNLVWILESVKDERRTLLLSLLIWMMIIMIIITTLPLSWKIWYHLINLLFCCLLFVLPLTMYTLPRKVRQKPGQTNFDENIIDIIIIFIFLRGFICVCLCMCTNDCLLLSFGNHSPKCSSR